MSWRNISDDETTHLECVSYVREVVDAYRRTGLKAEHAASQAALDLGLTDRRVRAYLYGEVTATSETEAELIAAGFLAHLDREAARLTDRAAQTIARRISLTPSAIRQAARFGVDLKR